MSASITAFGLALAMAGCDPGTLEDGGDVETDEAALSTDCSTTRAVTCHDSPNDCSYAARLCDPVPRALDRPSCTPEFPLRPGAHLVEDSLGNPLGHTTGTHTHLNWGQRRVLHGTTKVLAWAVATDAGAVTGWLNEDAIAHDLSWMPTAAGRDPGGSFSTWHLQPSNNAPYLDGNGHSLKVVATCASGMNATDYLSRNGRVNVIFNLPGYQNPPLGSGTLDTYPENSRLVFHRAESQRSIERPLWSCASGKPVATSRTLRFLYGFVDGAPARFGWVAEPVVAPGP